MRNYLSLTVAGWWTVKGWLRGGWEDPPWNLPPKNTNWAVPREKSKNMQARLFIIMIRAESASLSQCPAAKLSVECTVRDNSAIIYTRRGSPPPQHHHNTTQQQHYTEQRWQDCRTYVGRFPSLDALHFLLHWHEEIHKKYPPFLHIIKFLASICGWSRTDSWSWSSGGLYEPWNSHLCRTSV